MEDKKQINKELQELGFKSGNTDKELEDAAELFRLHSSLWNTSDDAICLESGYKAGYKAHEEKSANEAIEFNNWTHLEDYILSDVTMRGYMWHKRQSNNYLSHKQLYQLWKTRSRQQY